MKGGGCFKGFSLKNLLTLSPLSWMYAQSEIKHIYICLICKCAYSICTESYVSLLDSPCVCVSVWLYSCLHVCVCVCVCVSPLKYPNWKPGGTNSDAASVEFAGRMLQQLCCLCVCVCVSPKGTQKHTHQNTVCWHCVPLSLLMINERHNMDLSALHLTCQRHVITVFFLLDWFLIYLFLPLTVRLCVFVYVSTGVPICSPVSMCVCVCVCVFLCTFICRARIAPFPLSNLTHRAAVIAIYTWLGPRAARP